MTKTETQKDYTFWHIFLLWNPNAKMFQNDDIKKKNAFAKPLDVLNKPKSTKVEYWCFQGMFVCLFCLFVQGLGIHIHKILTMMT